MKASKLLICETSVLNRAALPEAPMKRCSAVRELLPSEQTTFPLQACTLWVLTLRSSGPRSKSPESSSTQAVKPATSTSLRRTAPSPLCYEETLEMGQAEPGTPGCRTVQRAPHQRAGSTRYCPSRDPVECTRTPQPQPQSRYRRGARQDFP